MMMIMMRFKEFTTTHFPDIFTQNPLDKNPSAICTVFQNAKGVQRTKKPLAPANKCHTVKVTAVLPVVVSK